MSTSYYVAKMNREPTWYGVRVGSVPHLVLLGLRAGAMTSSQLRERFSVGGDTVKKLIDRQLVEQSGGGGRTNSFVYALTALGRELVSHDGPLARRKTLITYCQL